MKATSFPGKAMILHAPQLWLFVWLIFNTIYTLMVMYNTTLCFINMDATNMLNIFTLTISQKSLLILNFCKTSWISSGDVRCRPYCTEECKCACVCISNWKSVGVRWYLTRLPDLCDADVFSCSNGEGRKRTLSGCSSDSLSGGLPATPRRVSWRQKIFLRVASPMNKTPSSMQHPGLATQSLK